MYPILSVPGRLDRNDQGVVIPWLWEVRAHTATVPESSALAKQQEPAARAPGHRAGRWNPEQASVWPWGCSLCGCWLVLGLSLFQKWLILWYYLDSFRRHPSANWDATGWYKMIYFFFPNLFHGGSNSDKEMSLPSTGAWCCFERKKKNPTENEEEHFLEILIQ